MDVASEPQPKSLTAPPTRNGLTRAEWGVILVLMAVQFTHMVDFVIIMPLGKRLMTELDIGPGQFAVIVSAYAIAAGVASLAASFVMDRFDRKRTLLVMYAGFAVSTLVCGLAESYPMLLVARTLAGVFGGVAAVALMAVVGDVFPAEKRGRAGGAIMSAFAVASVVGLPVGLRLSANFGRGAPFLVLGGLSAVIWVIAAVRLPAVRGHLTAARRNPWPEFLAVVREPNHLRAFAFTFFMVLGTFTVASFISPYLCSVNGWTPSEGESHLEVVYMVAGACTFVSMTYVGRLADRVDRRALFTVFAVACILAAVVTTNLPAAPLWVIAAVMSTFMVFASCRMVPVQALLLGAAAPRIRGAFLSVNTAVQHLSTGVAPLIAGALVSLTPDPEAHAVRTADAALTGGAVFVTAPPAMQLHGYPLVGIAAALTAAVSLVLIRFVRPAGESKPVQPLAEPKPAVPAYNEVIPDPEIAAV